MCGDLLSVSNGIFGKIQADWTALHILVYAQGQLWVLSDRVMDGVQTGWP